MKIPSCWLLISVFGKLSGWQADILQCFSAYCSPHGLTTNTVRWELLPMRRALLVHQWKVSSFPRDYTSAVDLYWWDFFIETTVNWILLLDKMIVAYFGLSCAVSKYLDQFMYLRMVVALLIINPESIIYNNNAIICKQKMSSCKLIWRKFYFILLLLSLSGSITTAPPWEPIFRCS